MKIKKTRNKFYLVTALVALCMLIISACSGKEEPAASVTPAPSTAPNTSAAPTQKPRTEFTFTMNTDNANVNWKNDIAQEITKRTGVTVKWDIITGDFRTKMNVWLAGGDYPEVVNIHDNTLQSYITANAVIDLAPLIKEHAPNIMKAYNNDLSSLETNGKVYGLLQPPTKQNIQLNQAGWVSIQAAVLKDAGYPQIKTLEDVRTIVANYIKKYPQIGGGNTIGFSNYGAANQLYNIFDTAARTYAGFPTTAQYFVDASNNVRLRFFEPGYTDAFKFFNKINAEGLFDQESLVQTPEQFTTKCNQGRVLVVFAGSGCSATLAANNMEDRSYITFDIVAPGKTKQTVKPSLKAARGGDMWISITKNAKDPVRIIQFYDDMYKLENQILNGWGIEGKYYTVVNGKRVVTPWLLEQIAAKPSDFYEILGFIYSRPLGTNTATGFTLSDGDFARYSDSEAFIVSRYNKVHNETLAKYNAKTFSDLLVKPTEKDYQFAQTNWTDEMKKFNTDAIAEWGKSLQKFILEKDATKLDAIWADLEKVLKDKGLEKINAEATRIYKEDLAKLKP